jgi:ribosomal RNA-processing protein 17
MLREQDGHVSDSSEDLEGDQWNGIAENPVVDHEDEYMDEDRFTTVTVEAVDVTRDGLRKAVGEDDSRQESGTEGVNNGSGEGVAGHKRTRLENGKRIWTKEPPKGLRKRKKKFHYESKAERKVTSYKERSGNKEKAKVRKS